MNPIDLLSAHPWRTALFTTYSLSLSFFESVALDALTRGGARRTMVVADVEGVRAALGEWGARGVGRAYELEPIRVTNGIFHPKVTVLAGDDNECHLLVGSGNLTFGGWGGNLEVLEHLHPSFAPGAFTDAADLFEDFVTSPRLRHGAQRAFAEIADFLRAAGRTPSGEGSFRLLHGLRGSISQEIAAIADGLGGAERLAVVSPFYDTGGAVDGLCSMLNLDEVFLHAHPEGAVFAHHGSNWPTAPKCAVRPVTVDIIGKGRPLHAKLFEVSCRDGRIIVSGSANATTAALGADGNVEAAIARIERTRGVTWVLNQAQASVVTVPPDVADDVEVGWVDVLRATLVGHRVEGRVLTKRIAGDVGVFLVEASGLTGIGAAVVDAEGYFEIEAASLGKAAWHADRLVIAVEDAAGRRAEGFVLAKDFREVADRIGLLADRFMALLGGTETPADVAAIMSWFSANPAHLKLTPGGDGGGSGPSTAVDAEPFSVAELLVVHPDQASDTEASPFATGASGWAGFMQHVFAAFRAGGGSWPTSPGASPDSDDDDDGDSAVPPMPDRAVPQAFAVFDALLKVLLPAPPGRRHALLAFDLAHYLCGKLNPGPARARAWLQRIVAFLSRDDVPEDRRSDVASAICVLHAGGDRSALREARRRLLDLGVEVGATPPIATGIAGFVRTLEIEADLTPIWKALQGVRTINEQRASYLEAFAAGRPSDGYPDLAGLVSEWPTLEKAIVDSKARKRVFIQSTSSEACMKHWRSLPTSELSNLRAYGFGVARNCCGDILVRKAAAS